MKKSKFFRINAAPTRTAKLLLGMIPFILTILIYLQVSYDRRKENPNDKALPRFGEMIESIKKFTFFVNTKDLFDENGNMIPYTGPNSLGEAYTIGSAKGGMSLGVKTAWAYFQKGQSQIWQDFTATMWRFLMAMVFIYLSIFFGLFMGCFPYMEAIFYKYVVFFDKIPTLVLTPILFIFVTAGNPAIITLIVMAVAPTIILDTFIKVKEIPREQITKGMTLNASTLESIFRITYAQIIPKVYDTIRLNFKSVINMLLIGELLGAEAGLGYRIFMVKRYTDMATIIPYIMILGGILYLLDLTFQKRIERKYKWANK